MTTVPLRDVLAFFLRHDQAAALEGAPWLPDPKRAGAPLEAIRPLDLPDQVEDARTDTVLYLGADEVCPAAEGWVLRLLSLTRRVPGIWRMSARYIHHEPLAVLLMSDGGQVIHRWQWRSGASGRATKMPHPLPPTPAERLQAVLLHELTRVDASAPRMSPCPTANC